MYKIKVRFVDDGLPKNLDEIESYIEENVCSLCRTVAKTSIKENTEYFKTPTICEEGSVCAAAVFLEIMMREEMRNNSNIVANMLKKIVDFENS